MPDAFHCILVTPEREVFNGEVTYANIPAHDGQWGIQHGRAPLLAKLGHGKLRLDVAGEGASVYAVSGGFFKMNDNKLSILTDEAKKPEEIDLDQARAALEEALNASAQTPHQQKRRQGELARARAMIALAGASSGGRKAG